MFETMPNLEGLNIQPKRTMPLESCKSKKKLIQGKYADDFFLNIQGKYGTYKRRDIIPPFLFGKKIGQPN